MNQSEKPKKVLSTDHKLRIAKGIQKVKLEKEFKAQIETANSLVEMSKSHIEKLENRINELESYIDVLEGDSRSYKVEINELKEMLEEAQTIRLATEEMIRLKVSEQPVEKVVEKIVEVVVEKPIKKQSFRW